MIYCHLGQWCLGLSWVIEKPWILFVHVKGTKKKGRTEGRREVKRREGEREEVGSVRGAMGKSHCQLGLGEQGEGALILFFPRSSLVLQQKQTPLSVSCKKSFRFGGPSGVIFPNPS